jgi:hypothetical protein
VANIYGRWLLEHMSRSRELFHVIVAAMKGARDVFAGYEVSKDLLVHKAAALSLLRTRIASCKGEVDDTTILTMLLLALLEDAMGDRDAYRVHRAQVARLTPFRSAERGDTSSEQFQAIVRQYEGHPMEVSNSLLTGTGLRHGTAHRTSSSTTKERTNVTSYVQQTSCRPSSPPASAALQQQVNCHNKQFR